MKKLLKRIFPVVLLKQCFLFVNTIKINTLDKILYGSYVPEQNELKLYKEKNPFIELNMDLEPLTSDIRDGFSRWLDPDWKQSEYILHIQNKPICIEPMHGWGISGFNNLIYFSLGFASAPYVVKPNFLGLFKKNNLKRLPKVISLRDTGEENYFHFYNDIISKLLLLRDAELLDKDSFVVVSEKLWSKNYFQTLINITWFRELNWYVQKKEWVETKNIIFCKPFTHTPRYFTELANLLSININQNVKHDSKRIMLTRGKESLRYIENENDILIILNRYGFKRIDTGSLSLLEQINLFSGATDVISIHGAGITNIMFCNIPGMRLLEIFHWNEYLPFHYVMLASIFGFSYSAVQGTKGMESGKGGFYLDPVKIEEYCNIHFESIYN